ncbi:polyprenyl synthetase family protein [Oceanithermus sp.]
MSQRLVAADASTLPPEFDLRLRELLRSDVEFIQLIEDDLITAGGKRIRPRLALLASEVLGGVPHALELALAVELLHSATLLHDDLVDDAETRRGREAAFRKYGNAVSVLSGDYLLSRVLFLLAETGRVELVYLFAEAARLLAEGEVLQFQAAAYREYSEAQYYRIIESKTAALMRAATEGAALLGDAPRPLRKALAAYGRAYGLAFQMRDDYLDLMGEEARLGKPVGGDVREGKVTLIALWLLEAHPDEVEPILLRRGREPGDVERLRRLAEVSGVAARVVAAIEERVEEARRALAALPEGPARAALEGLALAELERLQ